MGGSSGGGGNYDTGPSAAERQALAQQSAALGQAQGYYGQMTGYGDQIGQMGNSAGVNALAGQGLTQAEQMQLDTIGLGRQRAEQNITQNTREQASARGLYSSAGAIGQEAAGIANLDTQEAQNRADIYGNAQQRQFQGLQMKSGLLGQAGSVYGQAGSGLSGVASGYGGVVGSYQNSRQLSNQSQQLQNQYQQQQQQNQMGMIRNTVGLIAAPYTGGMSLGMIGGGQMLQQPQKGGY